MAPGTGSLSQTDALKQVMESGIINPEAKLKDLVTLTQGLSGLGGDSSVSTDGAALFIHSAFVVFHMD